MGREADLERAHVDVERFAVVVGSFVDRAGQAGYVRSRNGLIHAWDCPSIRRVVAEAEESLVGEDAVVRMRHGAQLRCRRSCRLSRYGRFVTGRRPSG